MGDIPNAKYEEDIVFMICMTVHWKDDPELLKQICLIDIETAPDSQLITIICGSQKAKKLEVLEWMFNHMLIKPSAEKSSLAFYLNESGLESKLNMPIHHMNKYYEKALNETNATTAEQMREIAKYCIIDAISYQRLMVKRNAINEHREVASVAFISLYDSHYFAVGMKVRNLLSAERSESLKEIGKKFHEINFKFNSRDELRIRRNSLKRHFALLNNKKEELEKKINLVEERGIVIIDTLKSEYSLVVFNITCLDAKQLALKIYINTFYGEAGNILAGRVTSAGQQNIKLIADLVRKEYFQKCDKAYDNGNGISKEEYWSRIVNISMEVIEKLHDEVNDFLRNDNGSSYLKMAYEKVLFPVVFTEKKKYYDIPHRREPSFNNKLFIRGVEIVKQGSLNTFVGWIVEDVLKEIINDILQIDLNGMVKTAVWKPNKNNKNVQHFISRMWDRHTCEEADVKWRTIKYIVVENDSSQKVGDKMEYLEVALKKLKDGNKT
ncbi:8766_t:CDS:10, partial [Funneliformis geosporum]